MIVMTHSYNFGHERLANEVILKTFQFLKKWTNLHFVTEEPLTAGQEYFTRYPEERLKIMRV